jgi:DNA mismatch repair protein MutS
VEKYEIAKTTPMMAQWATIRQSLGEDPSTIVFCRVGDFYELFYDDAIIASKALDIQLTRRKIGKSTYPMAGVPHRSLENYVARLVNQGFKVAIIDQLEDAKLAKGKKAIKRGLTRIVTRGTVTEESMLIPGKNNYLAAIHMRKSRREQEFGLAVCDLSTGDFRVGTFTADQKNEILRAYTKYSPVEVIYSESIENPRTEFHLPFDNDELFTPEPPFWFEPKFTSQIVNEQFQVQTVQGYGLQDNSTGVCAAGALIKYLKDTQFTNFPHLSVIRNLDVQGTMTLDTTAIKGLELFNNSQDQSSYATLIELMDETETPMGSRLLRHWMANPLANVNQIEKRLTAVNLFVTDNLSQYHIRSILSEIGDIERLITRISMGTARPDELIKLAASLEKIPDLRERLLPVEEVFPENLIQSLDPSIDVVTLIRKTIAEEPGSIVGEGKVIKIGYNGELDRLRNILAEGKEWINRYVEREQQKTGITSLKIKQNNVFGYFIEISKRELAKIPEDYIRKQVMVNVSRFFSEELKNWETEILEAEINISKLEDTLYKTILDELTKFTDILQITSNAIGVVDCLASFAYLADRQNYCRPRFNEGKSLTIKGARHPVIESINTENEYVPNDISLDHDKQRIIIVTGPNYSGKSSLLRATALIAIMAQMGSYVPADNLEMGVIDRIFTRIGASDNLVAGQSTFMLEMVDAANLVNNSTDRSLIIADELGRGTSTYDGLAIAWSIAEYLHNSESSPKTLIATHYHQLAELEDILVACKNYQFVIRFEDGNPIFNHKLERGSSDKSFGVEVAKLSGLPNELINRARQILEILEQKAARVTDREASARLVDLIVASDGQATLDNWFGDPTTKSQFSRLTKKTDVEDTQQSHPIIDFLNELQIDKLTPVEALKLLSDLKRQL